MLKQVAYGLLTVALAVSSASTARAGKSDDTLRVASNVVPESLDSYFNATREGVVLSHHIWSYLTARNPKTGEYQGDLATSWKWIDDQTIEFTLRKGVTFHNGDPFTADDVVYTLNFIANPANKITVQQNVNWIAGAEKVDDFTVRVRTKAKFPAAIEYLSAAVPIYPAKYYAAAGPSGMSAKPVGSGPYRVTDVVLGKQVKLQKNPDYYKDSPLGQPSIGTIDFRIIPEQTTQLAEVLSGQLDWIWRVPTDQAQRLAQMPNLTVLSTESMRIAFLQFNMMEKTPVPALRNLKVRQAISHAIDRATIAKTLLGPGANVLNTLCFPEQFGCTDEGAPRYEFDPAKARRLLAEAGYPEGFDMELWSYRDRPQTEAMINYLRNVGIRATVRMTQYPALISALREDKAGVAHMTYGSYGIMDTSATASAYLRGDSGDLAHDKEVIHWLTVGDTTISPEERKKAYRTALDRAAAEALVLPLFSIPNTYVFKKELDFTPDADELARFYAAKWK